MSSHQGGDRLSPGSLDMRLAAELNKLEYMEESVRQLTDVERTRAVSLAQQETVSLAQILKVMVTNLLLLPSKSSGTLYDQYITNNFLFTVKKEGA